MAGGAGSGKTTFVKGNEKKAIDGLIHSILELKNFEYLNPDTYIEDKDSPMYNSLTKASQQIDDVDVPKNIEAKNNFIWDTTASNAAKMVGGEYKRKQTPGVLNTPDYDKMMVMVYAHPIVSFLENFKRERKVPKIGILSTWNNVYGNIEAFERKLGDNFIIYEAPTNQFYQKEIDQFNEAVRQGKLYEFYCGLLPKSKSFFRYVKSTKSINQEQVNALAKYYMCSTREVIDVLPLLEEQEIERTFNETQGYVATKKTKKTKNASSTKKNRKTK